jgi:membrane-associated phospholipid phosphatase
VTVAGGIKHVRVARTTWPRNLAVNAAVALAALARRARAGAAPVWRAYARVAAGAAVSVVALAVVMLLLDARAAAVARGLPRSVINIFEFVTDFGQSGWFLVPAGAALVVLALLISPDLPRLDRGVLAALSVRIGFIFVAIALPSLAATIGKRIIARARPFVAEHVDPFLYRPFSWDSDYASLPSGHATTAFAALVAIGLVWPRLRPLMWCYALVIAASRVAVMAHYPSDVLAGAIVGAAGALLVRDWYAARRLGFTVDAAGRVRALPGPSARRLRAVARRLFTGA